jgi:hypothetical protein
MISSVRFEHGNYPKIAFAAKHQGSQLADRKAGGNEA